MQLGRILGVVLLLSFLTSLTHAADRARELWIYYPTNLLPEKNIERLEEIWSRAAKAGYTHVLLADSKFSRLAEMEGTPYYDHAAKVRAISGKLNLKLVPALFSVGYSNDLLNRDPNLAEGLPVVDTPFAVKDGVASIAADKITWPKPSFVDASVKIGGDIATVSAHEGNARVSYRVNVMPSRCYHVSVWVKTDEHTGQPEIKALAADGRSLQFQNLGVKHTQDWTEHHVIFNSQGESSVSVYFGVWGDAKGTLAWRNWKIEEVGLLNVLRRPGTPVTVKGENGHVYREGTDYEKIVDPRMGNQPYNGEYEVWHEPPTIKTKLPDGTKLRVSWYHPAIIYDGQVCACVAEPKFNELLADQAKRMKLLWRRGSGAPMSEGLGAAGWMMSHDEFRTLGWCKACQDRHETPGQLLADNVKYCANLLRGDPTYVWSDMFDPFHNAVKGPYYLVNGSWENSWEALPKDVVIMNWNHEKRDQSLKFFADRGHKQIIAAYYDEPSLKSTREWLASTANDESVIGFMYTTWANNYDKLEAFAELVRHP